MDDKMISWDCLRNQKQMAEVYAQVSTEMSCPDILRDTAKICQDNLWGNHDIFTLMNSNGWYQTPMASPQQIMQVQGQINQMA